ncbi:hypothetical protein TrRE_jg7583, partial [Triparma retinervis]
MYSNTGSTFCTVCGAGTYQVSQGSPSCDVCAAGTFISDAGTDSSIHDSLDDCIVCGAGKVLVDAATTASLHDSESDCELCPENTFNADNGVSSTLHDELSDCTACPPGMPGSLDRKVCGVCIKGSGISTGVGASGGCEICKAGYFSDIEDSSPCQPCSPGAFITDDGVSASAHEKCEECNPGSHANAQSGASDCNLCTIGKYQPSSSSTSCLDCDLGKYGETEGLTSPTCTGVCLQGFFCDIASFNATQTQCPADHFCAKGTTAPEICLSSYARTCTKGEGELCDDNTLCLGRQCSGLNLTTVA